MSVKVKLSNKRSISFCKLKKTFNKNQKKRYKRCDYFYFKAKECRYVSRSIFKLKEINHDFNLISKEDFILDLGCSPGSWIQYVEKIIFFGSGRLVGVDLLPIKASFGSQTVILQEDIYKINLFQLKNALSRNKENSQFLFNIILSDMAPNTTGIKSIDQERSFDLCERVLMLSKKLLKPGGKMCVKILEGIKIVDFISNCKKIFVNVKIRRPKATRAGSKETYIIAIGKK